MMNFTYYGQSCFQIEAEGRKFLFDPFISGNPLAGEVNIEQINPDYILISHGHQDHVADAVSIAKRSGAQVFAMVEVASYLRAQGISNLMDLNYGTQQTPFGKLRTVWAAHSSGNPDGSYGGNPAGYVLELGEKKIYFAGDTSLTQEMKLLKDLYNLDYAILPIGGHYTMDVDDAILASDFVGCPNVIGVHYDTFPPIRINKEDAIQKFVREGKKLFLPAIGESIQL